MSNNVIVPLQAPIKGHAGAIKTAELRPPTAGEFFEIGEPHVVSRLGMQDDAPVTAVENDTAIARYLDLCLVSPGPIEFRAQASLADAMAVKRALLGFFVTARTGGA